MVMTPTHVQLAERCAELLALDEKRTPELWQYEKETARTVACVAAYYGAIVAIPQGGGDMALRDANAAFIAAAPHMAQCIRELLEALREAEAKLALLRTPIAEDSDDVPPIL